MGAATRYLQQRYSMPHAQVKGSLTDIGISVLIKVLYSHVNMNKKGIRPLAYPSLFNPILKFNHSAKYIIQRNYQVGEKRTVKLHKNTCLFLFIHLINHVIREDRVNKV